MTKILVVDDDQDFVSAVQIVLENAGCEVQTAHSRQDGMAVYKKYQPQLVLLDVMMQEPDDGFVMAQELKKCCPQLPILMLTSVGQVTGMDFDKDDEMVPVDAFEQKPIMPARLLERIQELLKK